MQCEKKDVGIKRALAYVVGRVIRDTKDLVGRVGRSLENCSSAFCRFVII